MEETGIGSIVGERDGIETTVLGTGSVESKTGFAGTSGMDGVESMIGSGWEGIKLDSIIWGRLDDETKEGSIVWDASETQWGNTKESRYELEGWSKVANGKMCS